MAASVGRLARDVHSVAAGARGRARWEGAAADHFSAHAERLGSQISTIQGALGRAAGAIRTYASELSSAQGHMQQAQSRLASVATLLPGAQESAAHAAQLQAAAAARQAQQAASTAAGEISAAIGALPRFGSAAQARSAPEGESGINLMEEIDKLNRLLGYPLSPAAIGALGFEATAVLQAWQASNALKAVPGEVTAWFDELVGPTGLAFDRGEATLADFAGPLARWQARVDAAEAFTKQGVDEATKLLGEGGIREGGALDMAGKFFGGLAIFSDALTVINPGEDGAHGTVTRVVAGVNGVATLAAMTGTLAAVGAIDASVGWVPVAGQVVIVATGLYLAGDWAYNNVQPFHDFVDSAASDTVSVAKTTWHGITSGASAVGHFIGSLIP